jgi:hypothetical protein
VDGEARSGRTWLLETEPELGSPPGKKKSNDGLQPLGSPRVELWRMLAAVALAGLVFATMRSIVEGDYATLLLWPTMAGFGIDRLWRGHGVLGGTVASGLGFAMATSNPEASILCGVAGLIWGFYLGVWIYIIVETLIYYFY